MVGNSPTADAAIIPHRCSRFHAANPRPPPLLYDLLFLIGWFAFYPMGGFRPSRHGNRGHLRIVLDSCDLPTRLWSPISLTSIHESLAMCRTNRSRIRVGFVVIYRGYLSRRGGKHVQPAKEYQRIRRAFAALLGWPWSSVATVGGGDSGDSGEESAHPKPIVVRQRLGPCRMDATRTSSGLDAGGSHEKRIPDPSSQAQTNAIQGAFDGQYDGSGREMVLFEGSVAKEQRKVNDYLEVDLDDVEEQVGNSFLALARYYSGKRYNPRGLFEEMRIAWGLDHLAPAKVIGDNKYLLEFESEEDRSRVLEGGPWRHKGDALIVVACDELTRLSEINIESIEIWARFYDLPRAMMKADFAKKLGELLGKVVKVDTRYPNYLRARVVFPLEKALVPEIILNIKGWGEMPVMVRYENVPHFCFGCGRIGHAERECPDESEDDDKVKFGEEIRASPPKRIREIAVRDAGPKVSKSLNFAGAQKQKVQKTFSFSSHSKVGRSSDGIEKKQEHKQGVISELILPTVVNNELSQGVKEMQVKGELDSHDNSCNLKGVKERVSFGTNMSSDDDSLGVDSKEISCSPNMMAIERFNTRKAAESRPRRSPLKVSVTGHSIEKTRKGKATAKTWIKDSGMHLKEPREEINQNNNVKEDLMELAEKQSKEAFMAATKRAPQNLTGSHGEARQEP